MTTNAKLTLVRDYLKATPDPDRGYALACFYCGDVDPDRNDFTDGIHPFYAARGQTARDPHDWGTIAAWAFAIAFCRRSRSFVLAASSFRRSLSRCLCSFSNPSAALRAALSSILREGCFFSFA